MRNPLDGLLQPNLVGLLGPVTQSGSQAESIWRDIQSSQVDVISVDTASGNTLKCQPDLVIVATSDIRQALVDCQYAGAPLVMTTAPYNLQSLDGLHNGKTRLLNSDGIGFARPSHGLTWGHAKLLKPGNVAIICQSGLVGASMLDDLRQHGQDGFSLFTINPSDSQTALHELLSLLQDDTQTAVVGLHSQNLCQSRMNLDGLSRLTQHKPVVMLAGQRPELCDDERLAIELLQHCGVIVCHGLSEFSQLVAALAKEDHQASQKTVVFSSTHSKPVLDRHWRYASALRHLSGVDPSQWLAVVPPSQSNTAAYELWRHTTNQPIVCLLPPSKISSDMPNHVSASILPTGPMGRLVSTLLQSNQTNSQPHLKPELSAHVRQLLANLPQQGRLDWPVVRPWLSQANIPVLNGSWVHNPQQALIETQSWGWPMEIWSVAPGLTNAVTMAASADSLTKTIRRNLDADNLSWMQPHKQPSFGITVTATRHAEFGPIIECKPATALSTKVEPTRHLLPLSQDQINQICQRLELPALLEPWLDTSLIESFSQTLAGIAELFYRLPEIGALEAEISLGPSGVNVSQATLDKQPPL